MLTAFKIRLYPNKTQEQTLDKGVGCYRFLSIIKCLLKNKMLTKIE